MQVYTAHELPPDVPGMVITEGDETAVLLNPAHMTADGNPLMQNVTNALLAAIAGAGVIAALAFRLL